MAREQNPGVLAEHHALMLLQAKGWVLLDQNWRCRWGELDLVLAKNRHVLVVEVKGRRAASIDGHGLAAFHPQKRRRMARAIHCWRKRNPQWGDKLLRVVLVLVPLAPSKVPVRWFEVPTLC